MGGSRQAGQRRHLVLARSRARTVPGVVNHFSFPGNELGKGSPTGKVSCTPRPLGRLVMGTSRHSDSMMLADDLEQHDDWYVHRLSTVQEMAVVIELVMTVLADLGYAPKDLFGARLALEEAICNAIKHGHHYDPTKVVEVRYCIRVDHFLMEVEDQGPGFDPVHVADATTPENLKR